MKIINVDYDIIPITQRCAGICKEHYPATLDFFHSNKAKGNGLDSVCKQCARILGRNKSRIKKNISEDRWKV